MDSSSTIVVVGGGLTGGKAVETLRSEGFDGRVVLAAAEDVLPYERPPLSKGVLLGNDDPGVAILHDQHWYDEQQIELRLGAVVTGLDLGDHEVHIGAERLPFDRLLLATGASPRRIDIGGADLDGVAYLRTMPDSLALLDAVRGGARVVVVGAGWIGLEVAAAARHHGCDVTVVEPADVPLAAALGPEMGAVFAGLHRDHGVDLRFGRRPAEFLGGDDGRVRAVRLDDGTELPSDLVVVGIGVVPDTGLAEAAGLDVDDGIRVDARLRTGDPAVFAAGDVARWRNPLLNADVRVEHWDNALNGGQLVARAMLDGDVSYDIVPYFFSDQFDLGMEYSGWIGPDGYDEVVVRGDRDGREFCAFWVRAARVLAGMNVNVWDVQDDIKALIRSGSPVDLARLADPDVALTDVTA